jgi:hypothetical protein
VSAATGHRIYQATLLRVGRATRPVRKDEVERVTGLIS